MKNKFSYIGLSLNIAIFVFLTLQFFGITAPNETPTYWTDESYFASYFLADISVFILWLLIYLSRKRKESKPLFLINSTLAVISSFWLLSITYIILGFT